MAQVKTPISGDRRFWNPIESSFPLLEEITVPKSLHFWGCYTLFYVIISNNPKDGKYHEEGRMQERGQGGME